jgi:hypothetical protein
MGDQWRWRAQVITPPLPMVCMRFLDGRPAPVADVTVTCSTPRYIHEAATASETPGKRNPTATVLGDEHVLVGQHRGQLGQQVLGQAALIRDDREDVELVLVHPPAARRSRRVVAAATAVAAAVRQQRIAAGRTGGHLADLQRRVLLRLLHDEVLQVEAGQGQDLGELDQARRGPHVHSLAEAQVEPHRHGHHSRRVSRPLLFHIAYLGRSHAAVRPGR